MANNIRSIHHIALKSQDFDKSCTFYIEGLGLKKVFSKGEGTDRMAFLELPDGSNIELFANGDGTEPAGGFVHLAFNVASADDAYASAMKAGGTSRSEPGDGVLKGDTGDMPLRVAFVIGPDNEVIEFFQLKD